MKRAEKTLQAMEANPQDWRYDEVATVLRAFGFSERKAASSHRRWTHPDVEAVTVVAGRDRVPEYQVLEVTRRIRTSLEEQ
jgi:predicted RNA binding protein YcfA (HicA-like mRNA interferase family)